MKKHLLIIAFIVTGLYSSTTTLVAQVTANQPPDYHVCDLDNDGLAVFDLTLQEPAIIGAQDPTNLVVKFYVTQVDANNDTNPIANSNSYFSSSSIIYARLEDFTNGDYDTTSFNIIVENTPIFTEVSLFEQCDDEVVDGFTDFDLNSLNPTITAGNPNLSVAYYASQLDAETATNPIASPYTNTINPEIIFVRVDNLITGCYATFEMELFVITPPAIFEPNALQYCDPDNDGFGEFMLTDADLEVTGGIPLGNLVVTYHYILTDALIGINPLPSPWLNDVPYNQTVHVRLFDQATGCFSLTTLVLVILDSPQIVQPTDLELYDDNGDGIEVFNLTLVEPELLNDLDPNLYSVYYYEDVNFTIPISNPISYSNIPPSPQTIYIWVEDIVNSCKSQTEFNLVLVDVLIEDEPDDLFINEGDDDGLAIFDLTVNEPQMLGNQDPLVALFSYFITLADSENDVNRISLPTAYQNITNPQTIFVRLTNSNSGNYVLTNFEIQTDGVLGVDENFNNSFKLYPNPSTGIINVQSNNLTETVAIAIYNLQGQVLLSENKTPENGTISFDVSGLSTGVYFIKIVLEDVSVIKRIVKQ